MNEKDSAVISSNKAVRIASIIIIVLAITYIVTVSVFRLYFVNGYSMYPTFKEGNLVYGERVDPDNLEKGDIVVAKVKMIPCIKRIIASPGDTIEIREGFVYVNGVREKGSYPRIKDAGCLTNGPLVLSDGEYFLMGDNRNESEDCRAYGAINIDTIKCKIKGKVFK